MLSQSLLRSAVSCWVLLLGSAVCADEPVTLETYIRPTPNSAEEPLAGSFSLEKATDFLDSASLDWQENRKCFACHTNYSYLMVRPKISAAAPAHETVRNYAEQLVTERWQKDGPRWDAEVVATAAALAINDAATTGKLHATTRTALDRMWTVQREDGGFDWLKCDWPPMESDDHYGATMAIIGVGMAPEDYQSTPAAQAGIKKIKQYFAANRDTMLHHRAMILWGSAHVEDLLTAEEKQSCVQELLALQRPDGGWATASLGTWEREDKSPQDKETSDGYGTGFVVYVLRQAGIPANDPAIQRGIAWIKSHQRESGRWFTRSLHKDSSHFLTHAGTAFSILALDACQEIPSVAAGQ